jgi:hypothetical protein
MQSLAQDRDQRRALVNTIIKFRVPENLGNSWVAEQLVSSKEGLSSVELAVKHKKGRLNWGVLAVVYFIIFCLTVCYINVWRLRRRTVNLLGLWPCSVRTFDKSVLCRIFGLKAEEVNRVLNIVNNIIYVARNCDGKRPNLILGLDGRIILRWILEGYICYGRIDFIKLALDRFQWLDSFEDGNESSGSMRSENFVRRWATISLSWKISLQGIHLADFTIILCSR